MKRRTLVGATVGVAASLGGPFAQQAPGARPPPGRPWRIGVLSESWPLGPGIAGLLSAGGRNGLVEGRDFVIDFKFAQGQRGRLPALAAELVAARPDLLLGLLNPEIAALVAATQTIPIVMLYAFAPVELGFVRSLAHPGGNVTGTTTSQPGVTARAVQLLYECVPNLRRVVTLTDYSYPGIAVYSESIDKAAEGLRLTSERLDLRSRAALDAALIAVERDRPGAVMVAMVGVVGERYRQIVDAMAQLKIPAMYSTRHALPEGGLMCYTPDFSAMGQRNAWQIDRILKGTKPADLPVEEPAKFLLVINMKTARALGLTIPQRVLLSADELIE